MEGAELVAVPVVPGPLRPLGPHPRDDLDEFIDEVLPDSDEGPGRFDVLLLVGGGGLLGWGAGMGGPEAATVIGALALGLGCILPVRWVWRAVIRHRVRRESLVLNLGDAETRRLVDAYEQIRAVSSSYATTKNRSALLASLRPMPPWWKLPRCFGAVHPPAKGNGCMSQSVPMPSSGLAHP